MEFLVQKEPPHFRFNDNEQRKLHKMVFFFCDDATEFRLSDNNAGELESKL